MRSVSAAVLIRVGSRYESDRDAGAAHLLEHLLFKGTPRRPTSRLISETIERLGGVMNAATDKEATVFWTKTAAEHLPVSLDLLGDIIQHSRLLPKHMERERSIIVEELGMSMDDPQEWVHNLIDEAMWPDHPIGRDVGGTKESVLSLTRGQLRNFMNTFYGPTNSVLVVAGGVQIDQVRELVELNFGSWQVTRPRDFLAAPQHRSHSTQRLQFRQTEQMHICLAYPGIGRYSEDRYALDILVTILGGSTTSRLFLEVREHLALTYDVHVYTTRLADTGSIVIYAGVDPDRAPAAVAAIRQEIERLRRRAVTHDELSRTLDYMKGRMYLGLEDTHAVASWLGSQALLMDRIISPQELSQSLEEVSPKDIRRLATELLDPQLCSMAAIGPNVDGILLEAA